jgi:beta-glucosidase
MRRAAGEAQVLLKNENNLLPIQQGPKKIAVFGQNASQPVATGGGSATVKSAYVVSPLDAITQAAKEIGAEVEYNLGAGVHLHLPPAKKYFQPKEAGGQRATLEFWLPPNSPGDDWLSDAANVAPSSAPDHTSGQDDSFLMLLDGDFMQMAVADQCHRVSFPVICLRYVRPSCSLDDLVT